MTSGSSINLIDVGLPVDYRPRQYSPVWHRAWIHWREKLVQAIDGASGNHAPTIFFRADDIGAGGRAFEAMCHLFRYHEIPLAMAVIPAWLSTIRRDQLFKAAPLEEPLWGWHQHGWRHVNWQRTGKKSEFGEQRPFEKQWRDILQGQQKMQEIFGHYLINVFTPPWNRLSTATVKALQELHFKGVSMADQFPRGIRSPIRLKNMRVQLDLHTRKAKDGGTDYDGMLAELSGNLGKKEMIGIMIHHQRMPPFAFEFLNDLLHLLKHGAGARFMSFQEILELE